MMRAANIGCLFLCLILFVSCNTYNNFRAYYNTYYNAKKSFKAGVESVHEQPVHIEPGQFISVYPTYPPAPLSGLQGTGAGEQYFSEAINNAAQILKRFPESKWVDNALLIIGKSYFFQHRYYPALQKFEKVLSLPKVGLIYEAVLWKSRVLFETGMYQAGTLFMREQIQKIGESWNINQKAIANMLLANYLAMIGKVDAAIDSLRQYAAYMEDTNLTGRYYFLLGQLYLHIKKFDKAYQAFANVERYNPEYKLVYYAELKSAQAAKKQGRFELARMVYNNMLDDDKNRQRYAQITYKLGKTAEQKGEFSKARRLYKRALQQPTDEKVSAKIYYSMAQLLSYHFKDYPLAAAYYDSSTAASFNKEDVFTSEQQAYGRYITLKAKISRIDSLLWLSSLSSAELDSVMASVKQKPEKRLRTNMLINKEMDVIENRNQSRENSLNRSYAIPFGFLNYQNETLVDRGIRQFKNVWGNRPLVDNWRRLEIARAASGVKYAEPINKTTEAVDKTDERFRLLEQIPVTPQQKKAKREQWYFLQYQLANLFFLKLGKPDSAAFYYDKVVQKSDNGEFAAKALYSLYKVYNVEGRSSKAGQYKQSLLTKYPNSVYAARLMNERTSTTGTQAAIRQKAFQIVNNTLLTELQKARKLEQLALEHQTSGLGANIYYQSIQSYIQAAKAQPYTASDSLKWKREQGGNYTGRYWKKVREMLKKFQEMFPTAPQNKQVSVWQKMLNELQGSQTKGIKRRDD